MKRFVFQFETLLRLRRNERDLKRQLLAEVLRRQDELTEKRREVEAARNNQISELRELSAPGQVDVDASAARRFYAGVLTVDISLIERERRVVVQQLVQCRQALVKADQAVKSLEKLAEKRQAEFRFAQERREALQLEEAWRALHAGEGASC